MPKSSGSINLLKNNNQTLEQIVSWVLTIGRVLVIGVELVALGTFLYRFSLDNQIQDIHTKILQEQAIVGALKKNEDTYRNLQDRLSVASNFSNSGAQDLDTYKQVVSFAPIGVSFNSITTQNNRMQIAINANSTVSLSQFINKLKTFKQAEEVSVDRIENKPESATIITTITLTLKQSQ